MIIQTVEVSDWGPHKELKLDLNAHIVGIIGSNGKGKSNLLQAIAYALTGDLNGVKGTSYIRNFGSDSAAKKATVKLTFKKGTKVGTITRTIKDSGTSSRELVFDGVTYKSAADVEKHMTEILGADKAAMQNAVYVKQGDIARFIKGTPSERQDLILKLMNLSFTEQRAEAIRKKLTTLRAGLKDYGEVKRLLESQLEEDKNKIILAESKLKNLGYAKECVNWLEAIFTAVNNKHILSRKIDNVKAQIVQYEADKRTALNERKEDEIRISIDTLNNFNELLNVRIATAENNRQKAGQIDALKNEKAILSARVKELKPKLATNDTISALDEKIKSLELVVVNAKERARIISEIEQLTNAKENQAANLPILTNKLKDYNDSIESLNSELTILTRDIALYELVSGDICPICFHTIDKDIQNKAKTSVDEKKEEKHIKTTEYSRLCILRDNTLSSINSTNAAIALYDSNIKNFNEQLVKYTTAEVIGCDVNATELTISFMKTTLNEYNSNEKEYNDSNARLTIINNSLKAISIDDTIDFSDIAIAGYKSQLNDNKALLSTLNNTLNRVNNCTASISSLTETVNNDTNEYNSYVSKINELNEKKPEKIVGLNTDSIEDIESVTTTFKTAYFDYTSTEALLNSAKQDQAVHKVKLEECMKDIEANNTKLQLIDDLSTIVTLTSRTGVPLAYANDVFKKITPNVQAMLENMQANFTVIPDEERPLTYKFVRTDDSSGYEMPQERLSGGQAIRLSIAVLTSCQQSILPEVGLLIFDEPSSHIDAEGVEHMRDMFNGLDAILKNSEMQLIVVDHNSVLAGAFDRTIELK